MKLRNLIFIKEDNIEIIGSLYPSFFYRISPIMRDYLKLFKHNNENEINNTLAIKYSEEEVEKFYNRLLAVKNNIFINDETTAIHNKQTKEKEISIITLNASRNCNLKCSYCFENDDYRQLGNMPISIALKAIDKFFKNINSKYNIVFTGGEPLLNKKMIYDVVEYVKFKNLDVEFTIKTNGLLIDKDTINFIIKNNISIQISLDGDEESHNRHRIYPDGRGTFKEVDKIIKEFINRKYGHKLSISGTLTKETINNVDNSYRFLNSYLGIKNYSLKPPMPNTDSLYVFSLEDYRKNYLSFINNSKSFINSIKSKDQVFKQPKICGIGIWNITIDVDGNIYPCYRLCGNKQYVMGNIDHHYTNLEMPEQLSNIYNLELREGCSTCYMLDACKTGCYSDKLMSGEKCFNANKIIVEHILRDQLITQGAYKHLSIV